jgi:hypothetical protein
VVVKGRLELGGSSYSSIRLGGWMIKESLLFMKNPSQGGGKTASFTLETRQFIDTFHA